MSRKTHLTRSIAFDRSRLLPAEASRYTVGVAITLIVATILRDPGIGALASIGALYTGMAASSGVYHARVRAMAASGFMIGLATAIGAQISHSDLVSLIVVFGVAFGTALYASSSRTAGIIGAQTTAILCVVIGLRLPPGGAWGDGLAVWSGAAVQLFLLTVIWPMREGLPERSAVADSFESLARFVLYLPDHRKEDSPQIPPSQQIQEARDLLSEAERLHWQTEHDLLFEALRRAEAIRAALVGFANADRQFAAIDRAYQVRSDRILRSTARSLRLIADRARKGQLLSQPADLKVPALPTGSTQEKDYVQWLTMLAKLINDCCKKPHAFPIHPHRSKLRSLFSALTKLPDIKAVRNVALQHALRYATTVELAFAISQHWSRTHSYWLPMTVALVLRQEYAATIQRGIARLVGTLAGLVICDALLLLLHPGEIALQAMTLVATWAAFATIQASYTVASGAITGFVVFSIASSGIVTGDISAMRLLASIAGCSLAVASYLLWPAWKWSQVWETLRTTAEAQSAYCEMVLKAHMARLNKLTEGFAKDEEIDDARSSARALRIQSENLLESISAHPKGLDKQKLKKAGNASQVLAENAATILVAQAAWNADHPETDEQLKNALKASQDLVTQMNEAIR